MPCSRHLLRDWCRRAEKLAEIPRRRRLGGKVFVLKFVNDMKADTPMADLCYLGDWKRPLTVMTVYQQADQVTMRSALTNRDQRRATGTSVANRQHQSTADPILAECRNPA